METNTDLSVPIQFEQLTREMEVKVYTGLSLPKIFQFLFDYLREGWKAPLVWPSRPQFRKTVPSCFIKLFPKVRCIIDCIQCFTETPIGLDLAATL